MSRADVSVLARAILYEGFALYPYRDSALKNRKRILFGTLFADEHPRRASTQVLVRTKQPDVTMSVRWVDVDDGRELATETEPLVERVGDDLFRVTAIVENEGRPPMGAAHVVLSVREGSFVSAIDPPAELAQLVAGCVQEGLFPVLVGPKGSTDTMLAAPIILYDHPEVAPESTGDLFDATEIEEILSLRIHTLTDREKQEIRTRGDLRTRRLLERVEALDPETYARLHGAFRERLAAGTRVRLRPHARADAFDVLLRDMDATVQSIEHTAEGRELVCVTIDCDPGKDLGARGLPGHRFFFHRDEMEVLG